MRNWKLKWGWCWRAAPHSTHWSVPCSCLKSMMQHLQPNCWRTTLGQAPAGGGSWLQQQAVMQQELVHNCSRRKRKSSCQLQSSRNHDSIDSGCCCLWIAVHDLHMCLAHALQVCIATGKLVLLANGSMSRQPLSGLCACKRVVVRPAAFDWFLMVHVSCICTRF